MTDTEQNIWQAWGDANWSIQQLTGPGGLTGGPPAASDPVCLLFGGQDEEMHVCYKDASGNIWHYSYTGSSNLEQLTGTGPNSLTGGPVAAGDPVIAFFDGHMYVFYRDNSGSIWFAKRNGTWSLHHLTGPGSSIGGAPAAGDPAIAVAPKWQAPNYYHGDQFHLCYRDVSGQIWYYLYDNAIGSRPLERLSGPPAVGDPVIIMYSYHGPNPQPGDVFDDQLQVFYRDSSGTIFHLWHVAPTAMEPDYGWDYEIVATPEGNLLGGLPAAADPVIIEYFNTLYMFYPDKDGVIWFANYGGTEWVSSDRLTEAGSETHGLVAVGSPVAVVYRDNTYWSMFYRDGGGNIWDVSSEEWSRKLRQLTGPESFRYLRERFGTQPPESLRALLIRMGPFNPETDAFRFRNKFNFTSIDVDRIADLLASEVSKVAEQCANPFRDKMEDFSAEIPLLGEVLKIPEDIIDSVVKQVVERIFEYLLEIVMIPLLPLLGTYGRCGGMAFAGYDFYLEDWPVDERLGIKTPPDPGEVENYISDRLFDSLEDNADTFLEWICILNYYPSVTEIATNLLLDALKGLVWPLSYLVDAVERAVATVEGGIFQIGGPKDLLDKTKSEWARLKEKLDWDAAWPIGIIFSDSISPMGQHQVLAIGYHDNGDGTATLDVWDSNSNIPTPLDSGPKARPLSLNFNGDELQVGGFINSRPVKGFFIEKYTPKKPPHSLNFS